MPVSGNPAAAFTHGRSQSSMPLLPYADSSPPSSPGSRSFNPRYMPYFAHKRRLVVTACLSLAVIALVSLSFTNLATREGSLAVPVSEHSQPSLDVDVSLPVSHDPASQPGEESEPLEEEEEAPEFSPLVLGAPTQSFRDNLRNDTKYITSWISAGWSEYPFLFLDATLYLPFHAANDIMTYANLIYLGSLTDRVPVVGMFTPSHIGGDVPPIMFGEVFDVPRFNEESGIQIVEWYEVKDPASQVVDDLGCWNVWEAVQFNEHHPRGSVVPEQWLKLGESVRWSRDSLPG